MRSSLSSSSDAATRPELCLASVERSPEEMRWLLPSVLSAARFSVPEGTDRQRHLHFFRRTFHAGQAKLGRVAASLLLDKEERIMLAALSNPQMTEMWIVKALKAGDRDATSNARRGPPSEVVLPQ